MGWKAQSYISSWEQPLPGTRLRTVTHNFLPVAGTDWLFHLQFLLFRWVEITAINIDGPVYGNDRTEYWQITIQAHVNCIEISDWKPDMLQSWCWSGSGGLQSVQGRWGDENSLSGPSQLWLIQHCLEMDARLFSRRNQKISDNLNCTEIGLLPKGLSLQDTAEHPGMGGLCWGRNQLCIFRGDGTRISYFRWPCGTLQGFNSSPGCWERWRSLSVTLENITKKLLANSSSVQKAFQMKCPEIQTLKHLKVLRC